MNFFHRLLNWLGFSNKKETKYLTLKLRVPSQTVETIKWLQKSSGSQTTAELISTALTCYDNLLEVYMSGGEIIFKDINRIETNFVPFIKLSPDS